MDESGADSPAGSQASSEGSSSSSSRSTSPEVVLVQGDDEDAATDEEDEGHSDDEEALSQGTVSLLNISNSDSKCTKGMSSLLPGEMNRSAREMKPLPGMISKYMTTQILVDPARLQTR